MRFLFLFLGVLTFSTMSAQSENKTTIAIYDFTYNPDLAHKEYLPSIKQFVTSSFQKSGRFTILNRSSDGVIKKELNLQKTRDYFSNAMVEQGKRLGAKYIVTGDVDRIVLEKSRSRDSESYSASFSFLLKVIDIEKNEIIASEQLSTSGGRSLAGIFSGSSGSPGAAVDAALAKIDNKVEKFIFTYFGTAEVEIVDVVEEKKGEYKKVLISGGSTSGLKKGMKLIVYVPTETKVKGKTKVRSKHIGEMKIELVEDADFSVCKVKSGGKEMKKYVEEGKTLMVKFKIK